MKKLFYGQINLTKLGQVVREHPELVKEFDSKDGKQKVINVNVLDREEEDRFGNTACVTVACKKDEQKLPKGMYFVSDLRPAEQTEPAKPNAPSFDDPVPPLFGNPVPPLFGNDNDDLPF